MEIKIDDDGKAIFYENDRRIYNIDILSGAITSYMLSKEVIKSFKNSNEISKLFEEENEKKDSE